MNEINRLRYLHAMGVDSYVSRGQVAGALATQRLLLVPAAPPEVSPGAPAEPVSRPTPTPRPAPKLERNAPQTRTPVPKVESPTVRFSLAAVFCGGIAWVEALTGQPLAREQVQLIQGMTRALQGQAEQSRVAQFDWPVHSNPQLDQGESVARAGVLAFLLRHIEEQGCRSLVILGQGASTYVDVGGLGEIARVSTLSTLQMLEQPACKRQVWADLQALVLRA